MDDGIDAPPPGQHQHLHRQTDHDISDGSSKDIERLSLAETLTEHRIGSAVGHLGAGRLINQEVLDDLCQRIEDWKGYSVPTFGRLLLHEERLMITTNHSDIEKMYECYLFERIFVCCKVVGRKRAKGEFTKVEEKLEKSNEELTRPTNPALPKMSRRCCKLPCFEVPEHTIELKDKETKEISKITDIDTVETAQRPKLRLKGRIFLKDVPPVLVYEEDCYWKIRVDWKAFESLDLKPKPHFIIHFKDLGLCNTWAHELKRLTNYEISSGT